MVAILLAHRDAVTADLAHLFGIHDYHAYPPAHVATLVKQAATHPSSWLHRELSEHWQWESEQTWMLADIRDYTALLWWAQTKDGQAGRNRPQFTQRPHIEPATPKHFDRQAIDEYLARPRV